MRGDLTNTATSAGTHFAVFDWPVEADASAGGNAVLVGGTGVALGAVPPPDELVVGVTTTVAAVVAAVVAAEVTAGVAAIVGADVAAEVTAGVPCANGLAFVLAKVPMSKKPATRMKPLHFTKLGREFIIRSSSTHPICNCGGIPRLHRRHADF